MNKTILFLLHLPPPVHGSSMVGQWIKESELINNGIQCRYINLLASDSVRKSGAITFSKLLGSIKLFSSLIIELIFNRPSLSYLALTSSGPAFYRDVLFVMVLKLFGVRRIFHLHNKGVKIKSEKFYNRLLYQFVFKNAHIILLSDYLYSDVEEFVLKSNVHVCPNGIPESLKNFNDNKKSSSSSSTKLLFLSNLLETKGVFVLLEALVILKQKSFSFECNFVGSEGDISVDQLQKRIKELGLEKEVKYLGKRYGTDKEAVFYEAEVFVFPTDNDCFPLVLLEAMQAKLPVVSTFEGGIPDIVGDGITGFLISTKNQKQLAQKLGALIQSPQLRIEMGCAGYERYERRFTLRQFEERLLEILEDVLYSLK